MAPLNLDFLGWTRAGIYGAVPNGTLTDGRLTGEFALTLRNDEPPNETAMRTVSFDLFGPGDVAGLKPGAVTHRVPAPGTVDFEETKCAYVEFAAPDLPWRYTPELSVASKLRPWLVLVTAATEAGEAVLNPGGTVTLAGAALATHPLMQSARWAHVQDDHDQPGVHRVSRVLSPRDLAAETEYLAVVVPAFTAAGQPAWNAGDATVTLPAYHWWSFHTQQEGDFPTLASRLKPAEADETLGRAPCGYTPLEPAPELSVRGALAPIGGTDAPVDQAVDDDTFVLTTPLGDPRRPVVGLPEYGDAWIDDPADTTTWGAVFRHDPRHRGVGGMGLLAGILEQDRLADAAAAQAGALTTAAQRLRNLVAGLSAARALWQRRLPADPLRRLAVFGPALGRMMTASGTVLDRATGDGRPLPPALFSTAARRVLRPGPARTANADTGAADPAAIIAAANTCPPLPERAPSGLPHTDDAAKQVGVDPLDDVIAAGVRDGKVDFNYFDKLYASFDRGGYRDDTLAAFDAVVRDWLNRAEQGQPVPVLELLAILDPPREKRPSDDELLELLRRLDIEPDIESLLELGRTIFTRPPKRPCDPVDLPTLTTGIANAIDPTVARPFVVDRVLATIDGLDDQPLTPPELCPDLDIPAWQLVRDHMPDWLLPGAQTLTEDSVVAVETNPAFVDAYLLGLNTQTIGELRFRNIPIRTGCTPLRQFWARTNATTNSYDDDIIGVHNWPPTSALGSTAHQTSAAASADLVVVFKTPLFRRYPRTIVYLAPAPLVGGEPDWAAEPDLGQRLVPSFQGSITPDITFFGFDLEPAFGARCWVVLEEPPHGFQFFNTVMPGFDADRIAKFSDTNTDGGTFASAAFADPYRVMIRGEVLIPEPV